MTAGVADNLRDVLLTLSPPAREHLRDVLIRDDADRDAIALTCCATATERPRLGGHHRLPDDVSGCAASGGTGPGWDWGQRVL